MSDSSDVEALEFLQVSDGYRLLVSRVQRVIEDKRDALERGGDKADEARGFLAACRMLLALPEQMISEAKSTEKGY